MKDSLTKTERKMIWNRLKAIALADGNFTQEEQELMANALVDVEQYNALIKKAKEDGVIDMSEEHKLFEGRMQIMERAYAIARLDNIITEDEQALLKEICHIIRELS